jgi:hypothetical protein
VTADGQIHYKLPPDFRARLAAQDAQELTTAARMAAFSTLANTVLVALCGASAAACCAFAIDRDTRQDLGRIMYRPGEEVGNFRRFDTVRWAALGRYITAREGVVTAEELALFLDPPAPSCTSEGLFEVRLFVDTGHHSIIELITSLNVPAMTMERAA